MNFKRIVVGTDFSEDSDLALLRALHLAEHKGADVVLAHAVTFFEPETTVKGSTVRYTKLFNKQIEGVTQRLRAVDQRDGHRRPAISTETIDAAPNRGLLEIADRVDADLIVVGTHGRTGFRKLLLGSVAERVLSGSRRDVLIVRGTSDAGGFDKVLVPVDFSPYSDHATSVALSVSNPGASIELLHAWHVPLSDSGYWGPFSNLDELHEQQRAKVEDSGKQLLADLDTRGRDVTFHAIRGKTTPTIHHRLSSGAYDLVVVGSHGRNALTRAVIGSVAEATARYAPCSAWLAHGQGPS